MPTCRRLLCALIAALAPGSSPLLAQSANGTLFGIVTDRSSAVLQSVAVEAIDGTFHEFETAGGFEDDSIPEDYCPFGIQAISGSVFVTYALRGGLDDVAGVSHGFVREFDAQGLMRLRIASINDLPIAEGDRLLRWPQGRRPDDHPGLSELGL